MVSKGIVKHVAFLIGVIGATSIACSFDTEGAMADFPPGQQDAGLGGTGGTSTGGAAGGLVGGAAGTGGGVAGSGGGAAGSGGGVAGTGGGAAGSGGGAAGSVGGAAGSVGGAAGSSTGGMGGSPPTCSEQQVCVGVVPDGWQGYSWYREMDFDQAVHVPAPCSEGNVKRYYKEPGTPFDCSCSCGDLEGVECLPARIRCTNDNSACTGNLTDWTSQLEGGECKKPGSGNNLSCRVDAESPVKKQGKCEADFTKTENDVFRFIFDTCGPIEAGGSCDGGSCLSKVDQAMGPCIFKNGDEDCPQGWSEKHTVFQAVEDTRGCSTCACEPDNVTCDGTNYTAYPFNSCGGTSKLLSSSNCNNLKSEASNHDWSLKLTKSPVGSGQCKKTGGEPTGHIKPTGQVTLCCQP